MKIFLTALTILFLNQNVLATGAFGENPHGDTAPSSKFESGSLATSAVNKDDQPKTCVACMTKDDLLSSTGTIWRDSSGNAVKSGDSDEKVNKTK